jgi:catechol 2,3-dioxygenase-like lactoylglutathione lyase family enzyme
MAVTGLNHINIRTTDVEASIRFYVDLLDLEFRLEPPGQQRNWLYDRSGRPIIHFRIWEADSESTGPIDHVALSCEGMAQIIGRLKARQIDYRLVTGLSSGVSLVLLKDPHGVALELNFTGE